MSSLMEQIEELAAQIDKLEQDAIASETKSKECRSAAASKKMDLMELRKTIRDSEMITTSQKALRICEKTCQDAKQALQDAEAVQKKVDDSLKASVNMHGELESLRRSVVKVLDEAQMLVARWKAPSGS